MNCEVTFLANAIMTMCDYEQAGEVEISGGRDVWAGAVYRAVVIMS